MRSGIHLLQNSRMIFQDGNITKKDLQTITMVIPPMVLKNLWDTIVATKDSTNIVRLMQTVEKIILDGYPMGILISMLTNYVVTVEGRALRILLGNF